MPLKKIKKMFARIVEANPTNTKRFKKIMFIIDNGEKYEYIIMKMPNDCDVIIPDNEDRHDTRIRIIEFREMGKRYSEKELKYRCQLLNRRRHREIKRKRDKRN